MNSDFKFLSNRSLWKMRATGSATRRQRSCASVTCSCSGAGASWRNSLARTTRRLRTTTGRRDRASMERPRSGKIPREIRMTVKFVSENILSFLTQLNSPLCSTRKHCVPGEGLPAQLRPCVRVQRPHVRQRVLPSSRRLREQPRGRRGRPRGTLRRGCRRQQGLVSLACIKLDNFLTYCNSSLLKLRTDNHSDLDNPCPPALCTRELSPICGSDGRGCHL